MNIIPKPVSMKLHGGFLEMKNLPGVAGDRIFSREMKTFKDDLELDFSGKGIPFVSPGEKAGIFCQMENGPGEEAYRLIIGNDGIKVIASAGAGLWHGLQTVRQLLLDNQNVPLRIPLGEIEDYPRFPWRGFMLDCARHFYSPGFIKKLIRILCLQHINIFHWHLTDDQGWRLPVRDYPLLTEIGSRYRDHRLSGEFKGGFYTEEEIKEIVAYAEARHIEVYPEIDLPGHTSSVLAAYPGLGCTGGPYRVEDRYGIFEDVLCAGNDAVFDLAGKVFDSLAEYFPSEYVHIGGDEVMFNRWRDCHKCKKRLAETGLNKPRELQSWITVKFAKMLKERGKTVIGWDEVLEDSEKYKLSKDVIVMSWRGRAGGLSASRLGHRVIMTPNTEGCYLDYRHTEEIEEPGNLGVSRVSQIYNMDPIDPGMNAEEAGLVMGGQGNLWSEIIYSGKIAEYMIFPRICALAESLWTPREQKDLDDFARRLKAHRDRLDSLDVLQYRGYL